VLRTLILLLAISFAAQGQLTIAERRGQQIFEHGVSAQRPTIEASLSGGTRIPASVVPCAGCHGHDGSGRSEAGVIPPDITWSVLTKPYRAESPTGRSHSPYTERSLRRAITMGIDPSGNDLSSAMPRFQLSMAEANDLIAYLKKLGKTVDPGITETTVDLGVILPPPSQATNSNRAVRQAFLSYFARVNEEGGIFSRRIELRFQELPSDPAHRPSAVLAFLEREKVFAIAGSDFRGAEAGISAIMQQTATPAIASFAASPQIGSPLNKYVFYLDGGVREETPASPAEKVSLLQQTVWNRTIASAQIITEAMKRAGRELTRANLIQALEGFDNVQTTLSMPVTFGPNRRIGSRKSSEGSM
jgi:mono/diheme cytochrome c family protein